MARGKGRSGRRYVRDAKGRFASKGFSGQTGGRDARLKSAGKKREGGGEKTKITATSSKGTLKAKPRSAGQKYAARIQAGKDLKRSQSVAEQKKFFAQTQKKLDAAPLAQSSARQAATDRLKIKTATKRKLKTDRSSVIPATPKARRVQGSRPASTVAKPRTKGNDPRTVARRVDRKTAVNQANIKNITRAERTGATQGRQYQRALKTQATLKRAQEFTKTGKLPGRDNSIKAQRERKAASQRLAAKRAARQRGDTASVSPAKPAGSLTPKSKIRSRMAAQAKARQTANAGNYQRRFQSDRTKAAAAQYRASGSKGQKYSTIKNPAPEGSAPFAVTGSTYQGRKNAAAGRAARDARSAQVSARGKVRKPAQNFKPAVKGKSAPDNARTRANKLKTAQNKVRMYSETDSRSAQNAIANRNAALKARPQGTPGKVIFRSKNRASSRFQQRANDLTSRIKGDLKINKPGAFSATGGGGGRGIVRRNTGDKQTSMFGKPAPLYTNKTAKSVKRRSGKRK